ncbi:MAG TPA: NIPSNAP family protein [Puia sp.]|nr:NIPSNAP family protein [Puia sp.]
MQRRRFVKSSLLAASALSVSTMGLAHDEHPPGKKSLFELREYEAHFGTNENDLHLYFQNALIPALNRFGVNNCGVFKETSKSDPAKIYLLIPYPSWEDFPVVHTRLKSDAEFRKASVNYDQITADKFPYTRFKTKLMIAFDGQPEIIIPSKEPRIFELRTYEGYNEDALRRKLNMFNEEEFVIFDRTKLNRVFFGEVIAGNDMPCLTYMITFANMEEHDKHWAAFGADPDWQRISKAPEYANSVSRITKIFLEPTAYSQI